MRGKSAPALSGALTATEALDRLLAGTGLAWKRVADGKIAVRAVDAAPEKPVNLPALEVKAPAVEASIPLDVPTSAASLNGLTARETPGAVEVITQERMQREGARTLTEAFRSAAGVSAGNNTGEPGVTSMRGFSRAATGFMVDGVRVIDPLLVTRDYDTFSFDRIEVLKGPASVTDGVGSLAGAINLVTKKPSFDGPPGELMASVGSFDTRRLGVGGTVPLSDTVALRADAVVARSGGFVEDTDSLKAAFTSSLAVKASDRLSLNVSVDYYKDEFKTPYAGLPLLPAAVARDPSGLVSGSAGLVADRSIRNVNYDLTDSVMESEAWWLRGNAEYRLTDTWKLSNELGGYSADRNWNTSDYFFYNGGTGMLEADATLITHDHRFVYDRLTAKFDGPIAGKRHRIAVGMEYAVTDLSSQRRFGSANFIIDPFNPVRGTFPADNAVNFPSRNDFGSQLKTAALFVDDAWNVAPGWLLVAGVRQEHSELDRTIDNLNAATTTRFGRDYNYTSWRIGAVVDVAPRAQVYASYNEAVLPITRFLLASASQAQFDLSTGSSAELGFKADAGNTTFTVSVYQVEQDDILTRDPAAPAVTIQGGSQRARGIEADVEWRVTPRWRVHANAAFVDSEFTRLFAGGGADLSGNRPQNVPATTFNLNTDYRLESVPVTLGMGVHHTGDFFADNANTVRIDGRTLLDASVAYKTGPHTVTLRGRNLTDEFYADWASYVPNLIYLGAPRSVELSWNMAF